MLPVRTPGNLLLYEVTCAHVCVYVYNGAGVLACCGVLLWKVHHLQDHCEGDQHADEERPGRLVDALRLLSGPACLPRLWPAQGSHNNSNNSNHSKFLVIVNSSSNNINNASAFQLMMSLHKVAIPACSQAAALSSDGKPLRSLDVVFSCPDCNVAMCSCITYVPVMC